MILDIQSIASNLPTLDFFSLHLKSSCKKNYETDIENWCVYVYACAYTKNV